MGGDFNLPSIEWGDEVNTRDPPSYGREINSRFIDVCDELGLTQVVRDPTRENNILDLMLVTSPDRCVDIRVNPVISDHDAVCLTYEGRVNINKKKPRTLFLFKRADMSSLMPPSHRRRGATTVFGENRHHRSDTASSFS